MTCFPETGPAEAQLFGHVRPVGAGPAAHRLRIDLDQPAGGLPARRGRSQFFGALAQLERDLICERTRAGLDTADARVKVGKTALYEALNGSAEAAPR